MIKIGMTMIATIRIPITTIQSLVPACALSAIGLVLTGVAVVSLVCTAMKVGLGFITRVAVTASLILLGAWLALNKTSLEGARAKLQSAISKKRMEMFVI